MLRTEQKNDDLITKLQVLEEENKSLHKIKNQFESLQREYNALKYQKSSRSFIKNRYSTEFWKEVEAKLKNDTDGIKALIVNGTITKNDVDRYGETLLHKAAFFGNLEIAQLCINMAYDIKLKNKQGRTPFDQAQRNSAHHIEQALLFAEMETSIGDRIKNVSRNINKQKGISNAFMSELNAIGPETKTIFTKCLVEVMINLIRKHKVFSDDMLCLCWRLIEEQNEDPLQSEIFASIMNGCQSIIANRDKYKWYWMKHCILPSNIWYTKRTSEKKENADDDTIEKDSYLYYKLLGLIKNESQKLLDELVHNMKTETNKDENAWNELMKYDIRSKALTKLQVSNSNAVNIRQDWIPNGIISEYTAEGLHREATNESFDGATFYDIHSYLPRLSLLSEIVDHDFQKSIQKVYNIHSSTNVGKLTTKEEDIEVLYRRGPVKLLNRAMSKTENDYYSEMYPTSAAVLDLNRCSLVFDDISCLLYGLKYFVNKVHAFQCGSIIGIVRCKNGFRFYEQNSGYADVKLNVLIRGSSNNIIGEVQFLLKTMIHFKIRAHNLYSIEREQEFMAGSATKLLPSLLDEDKQIKVLSAMGNTKEMCRYLLYHNKTERDILLIGKEATKDKDTSILIPICKGGKRKAFHFIMESMSYNEKITHLFKSDEYESTPIERAIRNNKLLLLKDIFQIKDVINILKDDKDWTLRVLYNAFKNCNDVEMIDYILECLEITQKRLIKSMDHQYSKNKSSKYFVNNIINETVSNNNFYIFKKLCQLMGEKAFTERMFLVDFRNRNAVEMALQKQKEAHIKYILNMKYVRARYDPNDIDGDKVLINRLIYNLFVKVKDDEIIDLVKKTWNISDDVITASASMSWKIPKPTQVFIEGSYKYHEWNTIGSVIFLQSLHRLKQLVSIIGEKVLVENVLLANGENINDVEYGVRENKLETIQYLLSFDEIRKQCIMNKEILWRIIYWTSHSFDPLMAKYILDAMELNEEKLNALRSYKCAKPNVDYHVN